MPRPCIMELRRDLDALNRKVNVLSALVLLALAWYAVSIPFRTALASTHELHAVRDGDRVRFQATSDGPFLIFGLRTLMSVDLTDKRVAVFATPLAVIDSRGASVTWKDLKWLDARGEPAQPPTDPVIPLYEDISR